MLKRHWIPYCLNIQITIVKGEVTRCLQRTDYDSQQHRSSGNNDIAWMFYITDSITNNPKFQEDLKTFRYHYEDLLLVNEAA